jgi:hypothetical protein
MSTTTPKKTQQKTIPALWIRSRSARGFRRCGFAFTPQGCGLAIGDLTATQIDRLKAEPALLVEEKILLLTQVQKIVPSIDDAKNNNAPLHNTRHLGAKK